MRSIAAESSKNWMFGGSSQAASSARSTSRPVMSLAWTTRRREWPPSRREVELAWARSNSAPSPTQLADALRALAHGDLHRLAVAQARAGDEGVLDVLLEAVALGEHRGDPPWAYMVLPSERSRLVSTATDPCPAASSAKERPATPPPRTRKSNRWGMECSCNAPNPAEQGHFLRFRRWVQ